MFHPWHSFKNVTSYSVQFCGIRVVNRRYFEVQIYGPKERIEYPALHFYVIVLFIAPVNEVISIQLPACDCIVFSSAHLNSWNSHSSRIESCYRSAVAVISYCGRPVAYSFHIAGPSFKRLMTPS